MTSYSEVKRIARELELEDKSADMSLRAQVQLRMGGGAAYKADEIYWALKVAHLDHYAEQVQDYARRNKVGQTSAQLGLRNEQGHFIAGRWIPQSQLVRIIDGLHIPISQEQLENLLEPR